MWWTLFLSHRKYFKTRAILYNQPFPLSCSSYLQVYWTCYMLHYSPDDKVAAVLLGVNDCPVQWNCAPKTSEILKSIDTYFKRSASQWYKIALVYSNLMVPFFFNHSRYHIMIIYKDINCMVLVISVLGQKKNLTCSVHYTYKRDQVVTSIPKVWHKNMLHASIHELQGGGTIRASLVRWKLNLGRGRGLQI